MKSYQHHIGDFDRATRHLTRIERSVYRDLLDLYYEIEGPIDLDFQAICRKILARDQQESTAVQQVLNEFFTESGCGWYHDRCEEEIERYRSNSSAKAIAGRASAEAKRLKRELIINSNSTAVQQPLNSVETHNQQNSTNHKPITINQEPITNSSELVRAPPKNQKRQSQKNMNTHTPDDELNFSAWPEMASAQVWTDYKKMRSTKRAFITQTVVDHVGKVLTELIPTGYRVDQVIALATMRNWQGLEVQWVLDNYRGNNHGRTNQPSRQPGSAVERLMEQYGPRNEEQNYIDGAVLDNHGGNLRVQLD